MTPQQIEQMRINSCRKGLTMYGEYAAGAMDASEWQRKHDIDKAFEWFKGFLQEIGYEDCDFGYDDTDELLIELRKAIEEEQ